MLLAQIIQPSCVRVPLEAKDKTSAITELIDLLETEKLLQESPAVIV